MHFWTRHLFSCEALVASHTCTLEYSIGLLSQRRLAGYTENSASEPQCFWPTRKLFRVYCDDDETSYAQTLLLPEPLELLSLE